MGPISGLAQLKKIILVYYNSGLIAVVLVIISIGYGNHVNFL